MPMTSRNVKSDAAPPTGGDALIKQLVAGVLILNLVVAGIICFSLSHSKVQYHDQAAVTTRSISQILDENISGILTRADIAMQAVADEAERQLATGAINDSSLNSFIIREHSRFPELVAFRATNAAGDAVYGPKVTPVKTTSLAHRDYFTFLRDTPHAGLVISKPLVGGITGKWMIVLARRINQPDGTFAGLVYAGVALDYLTQSFAKINAGPHGVISFIDADLRLVARYPEYPAAGKVVGRKIMSQQFLALVQTGQISGTYTAKSSIDSIERLSSFRRLPLSRPHYVVVGLATADYLSRWRDEVFKMLLFMCAFLAMTSVSTWLFYRGWSRTREGEARLRESEKASTRTAHENTLIAEIGRIIGSTLNIEEVYEQFAEKVRELIPFDRISVNTVDLQDYTRTIRYVNGEKISGDRLAEVFPIAGTWTEHAIKTKSSLLISSKNREDITKHFPDMPSRRFQAQSTMLIPLISKQELIGVMAIHSADNDAYSENDLRLAEIVGSQIAGAIANAQLFHELKQAESASRQSEDKFRRAVEYAPFPVMIHAEDGEVLAISQGWTGLSGYTHADIPTIDDWTEHAYGFRKQTLREYIEALYGLNARKDEGEFTITCKDQTTRIWEFSSAPLGQLLDGRRAVISMAKDITDRRRLEEERIEMERELLQTQKLQSLGVLAGGIAHDFNNLLMAILGNLELAREEISPLSAARPYLENSEKASRRAADLTRQMLAYSGKGRFVVENMNLSELVQENIHIFRSSVSTSIDLRLHLTIAIPFIMADAGQIQQVVMNLITNAAEAIGDKAGAINLTTGVQTCDEECLRLSRLRETPAPGDFVYMEVTDTGCGMDDGIQQKIFDPFFTTKFTGRGLGMSALQGIMLGHKGAIFVDSEVGQGTTIRVIFPVSPALPDQETATIPSPPSPEAPVVSSPSGIILIADDEEAMRDLCSDMVARMGYQTLTAADGEEAVAVFRDHGADIVCVILDLTMPKMDGYVTFQSLKQLHPDVKVILSSGYNEQAITQRFTGLGLAGFIQKPYRRQQLQDELKRVMKE